MKAENAARKILEDAKNPDLSSPQIANQIIREIRRLTGVADPFEKFKALEMEQAQKIFFHLKDHVGKSMRSLVHLAVIGNSLDYFNNPEKTLAEIPRQFCDGISFFHDDVDRLEAFLETKPETVLYLTDNAGEIYFDLPLYDYIKKNGGQTYLVVKGKPSLNDLTRVELKSAKLEDKFDNVRDTGTDGAGIDWQHVSKEFLELIAAADLILSKGMANFETLYPRKVSAATFYLFKVKCEPIQNYVNAPLDSYLAVWKEGTSS